MKPKKQKRFLRYALVMALCLTAMILSGAMLVGQWGGLMMQDSLSVLDTYTQQTVFFVQQKASSDLKLLQSLADMAGSLGGPDTKAAQNYVFSDSWNTVGVRLTLSNADGVSVSSDGLRGNIGDEAIFRRAMSGESLYSDVIPSVLEGGDAMVSVMIAPIYRDGVIVGTLASSRDVDSYDVLSGFALFGQEGRTYLMCSNGAMVGWSGSESLPLGFLPNAVFDDSDLLTREPELVQLQQDLAEGKSGQLLYEPEDGEACYLSYAPLNLNNWFVVNSINAHAMDSKRSDLQRLALIAGLVAGAVCVGLLVVVFRKEERQSQLMEHAALYDTLTGLPNWKLLRQEFETRANQELWSFVLLRIPDFQHLNDLFGYSVGAGLLKFIAATLSDALQPGEVAARVSEGNFALLLHGHPPQLTPRLNQIFHTVMEFSLADGPIVYDYRYSLAAGALPLEADETFSVANQKASAVMEGEARKPGLSWNWFDLAVNQQITLRDTLMPDILRALKSNEFIPYFQPQYNVTTRDITGAEVLARWKHPVHGVLPPNLFVPMLEASGYILELDMVMLDSACKMLRSWLDKGLLPVHLSINISALNIHRKDFLERVLSIVHQYGIPPQLLSLELTETVICEYSDHVLSLLNRLKQEGFILSMDDFGSGYSSLNTLQGIPVSELKLDRAFLLDSEDGGQRGRVILQHIVDMARELELTVIAEGVETQAQEDLIRSVGCQIIQGFFFSHPLDGQSFEQFLFREDDSE